MNTFAQNLLKMCTLAFKIFSDNDFLFGYWQLIHCIGGEFARTLKLQVKQQFIKLHVLTTSCTGTLVSKEHTLFCGGEGEMRGSQNSLTVLFFKDSRKSAYLQLVDKLSARLQIRRIKPVPLASSNLF